MSLLMRFAVRVLKNQEGDQAEKSVREREREQGADVDTMAGQFEYANA